jgi:hypothetical protein
VDFFKEKILSKPTKIRSGRPSPAISFCIKKTAASTL